ncbi:hypothetical protein NDA14_002177 [Ustilago hordei]|uniref:Uncharacterized protein n=1 Tax=Ustilago hordei TaxID=120017 RepID=I2G5G7_USTHO|nr:uncharacterized protein UHO2_01617 [Ustilago hordei]KAJ1600633.1 hypothetical protein NDA14_002177 [Ustilago hordei]CCF54410.1 uncharacterized protein UHOR_16458 [Ustilago hordei]SYW85371.1 uncharacterized protein UHO2_01617 [Ustilago hordei]
MVKLTLPFVILGLGLATAASALEGHPIGEWVYENPYKETGAIGDANLDKAIADIDDGRLWTLRDAVYKWATDKFDPLFNNLMGICEEESTECNKLGQICNLDTPGCRRIKQGEERDNVMEYFGASYLTILTHGRCDKASRAEKWCSQLGLCNKYYVKDDKKCLNLDLSQGSEDVRKVMAHSKPSNGNAFPVEFDVPEGSYILTQKKKEEN